METKHEKFERMRDARLPKITHALDLLSNLGSSTYESSPEDRQEILKTVHEAVEKVTEAFGFSEESVATNLDIALSQEMTPKMTADELNDIVNPADKALGGAIAKHEINWAYDALQRKDYDLAKNRIKRIIDTWK